MDNDTKAKLFDKILDRFAEGEPIQDEYDLHCYLAEWLKEIEKTT